jgi:hypothetical protein
MLSHPLSRAEWCWRYRARFHQLVVRKPFTRSEWLEAYYNRDVTLTPEQSAQHAAILWGGEK